jgi:hypothetical protein
MKEHKIVAELGTVMDQLAVLPNDALSHRSTLLDRRAALRKLLAAAQVEAGRDPEEMWAEQAARKQPVEDKPFIEIHLPDSSMGGG